MTTKDRSPEFMVRALAGCNCGGSIVVDRRRAACSVCRNIFCPFCLSSLSDRCPHLIDFSTSHGNAEDLARRIQPPNLLEYRLPIAYDGLPEALGPVSPHFLDRGLPLGMHRRVEPSAWLSLCLKEAECVLDDTCSIRTGAWARYSFVWDVDEFVAWANEQARELEQRVRSVHWPVPEAMAAVRLRFGDLWDEVVDVDWSECGRHFAVAHPRRVDVYELEGLPTREGERGSAPAVVRLVRSVHASHSAFRNVRFKAGFLETRAARTWRQWDLETGVLLDHESSPFAEDVTDISGEFWSAPDSTSGCLGGGRSSVSVGNVHASIGDRGRSLKVASPGREWDASEPFRNRGGWHSSAGEINSVSLSSDGKVVAVCSAMKVRFFRSDFGDRISAPHLSIQVFGGTFLQGGHEYLVATRVGYMLADLDDSRGFRHVKGSLSVPFWEGCLVLLLEDRVLLVEPDSGKVVFSDACEAPINGQFSPDGQLLAIRTPNRVKVWHFRSGRKLLDLAFQYPPAFAQFSRCSSLIATGGRSESAIWQIPGVSASWEASPCAPFLWRQVDMYRGGRT
jgi:WD40 repeat protein